MLRGGLCGRPEDPSDLDEIEPCGGSTRPETCCAAATTSTSQTSAPAGLPLPRARWPRRPSLARPRAPRMAPLRPRSTPGPRDGVSSRVTCGDATAFPGTRRPSDRAACRRRGVAPTIAHGDLHGPPGHGPARRNTAAARGRTTGAYVRRLALGFIACSGISETKSQRACQRREQRRHVDGRAGVALGQDDNGGQHDDVQQRGGGRVRITDRAAHGARVEESLSCSRIPSGMLKAAARQAATPERPSSAGCRRARRWARGQVRLFGHERRHSR